MPSSKSTLKLTTRDPDASKEAIIIAATQEFAELGLGGARVDRIAEVDENSIKKRLFRIIPRVEEHVVIFIDVVIQTTLDVSTGDVFLLRLLILRKFVEIFNPLKALVRKCTLDEGRELLNGLLGSHGRREATL